MSSRLSVHSNGVWLRLIALLLGMGVFSCFWIFFFHGVFTFRFGGFSLAVRQILVAIQDPYRD